VDRRIELGAILLDHLFGFEKQNLILKTLIIHDKKQASFETETMILRVCVGGY